jgi:hypothetical protein
MGQKVNSIPRVDISNKILVEHLKKYVFEFRESFIESGIPIVKLDRENDTLAAYISYFLFKEQVYNDPPGYYAVVDNIPVLVYTGFEKFFSYPDEAYNSLFAELGNRLKSRDPEIIYSELIWKVEIFENYGHQLFSENMPAYSSNGFSDID